MTVMRDDCRVGMWSAACAAVTGVVYVLVGIVGVVQRPPGSRTLQQVDPYLAIMEVLILISAVSLVVMMAAVYEYAERGRKALGLAAFAFTIAFAVLTCCVHFVELTSGRQMAAEVPPVVLRQLWTGEWPNLGLSVDLLAWDFFLGLGLILGALVFREHEARRVKISMLATGGLCLAGTLGPATGYMRLQYLAIAGYGFALTVACALLALFFSKESFRAS
jgi:uncharacterized membrane protein